MQTAATGGTDSSELGRRAFWQSDATLPGVSLPSSVVRSTIDTAVLKPQSLEPFLMLRVCELGHPLLDPDLIDGSDLVEQLVEARANRCGSGSHDPSNIASGNPHYNAHGHQ